MTHSTFDVAELVASARAYRDAVCDYHIPRMNGTAPAGRMLRAGERLDHALAKFPVMAPTPHHVDVGQRIAEDVVRHAMYDSKRASLLFDPFQHLVQPMAMMPSAEQREELLKKFTETWEAFRKPPGCTCKDPKVWVLHDHHELEVDASCEAHKALWAKIRALETEERTPR